jgi:uncharacterized protein YkwD
VISFRRRGGALLLGIATGSMLIGGVAVAAPATVVPSSWQAVLGAAEPSPPPAAAPPTWRTAAPVTVAPPPAAALPAVPTPAVLAPPAPTTPPPTTTPQAVPVRALVDDRESEPESDDEADGAESGEDDAAAAADTAVSGYAAGVIELTNEERRDAGCGDLAPDSRLARAAQHHASDMADNDYFAHESEDGTRFDTRIREEGHPRPGGENIAKGQSSAEQVVREWMNSPPHRRNIENCAFRTIGVGYDDRYWVQDFGK